MRVTLSELRSNAESEKTPVWESKTTHELFLAMKTWFPATSSQFVANVCRVIVVMTNMAVTEQLCAVIEYNATVRYYKPCKSTSFWELLSL